MQPSLREGQLLLIRYAGGAPSALRPGCLVLITLPPDSHGRSRPLAIKRLTRLESDGALWVESDNTADVHRVDSWTVGALAPSALVATVTVSFPWWLGLAWWPGSARRRSRG